MTSRSVLILLIMGVMTLTGHVALSSTHTLNDPPTYATEADQRILSDLEFRSRQEAAEMRELATKLALEAQLSARLKGEDHLDARRVREWAEAAWRSAQAADERASAYRRLLPHGRVY